MVLRTRKNQKPWRLPLHQEILQAIEVIGGGQEYIYWSGDGNAKSCVGDWQRTLRRLSVISGVNITAQRFRHTFACELLSKGVPVSEVAAILGNIPRTVEKHYSQWFDVRQKALDAAVRGAWVI